MEILSRSALPVPRNVRNRLIDRDEHLELRALLPASRLVMLEGGGHFPQEDAPDAVTRELNAFLTAVP